MGKNLKMEDMPIESCRKFLESFLEFEKFSTDGIGAINVNYLKLHDYRAALFYDFQIFGETMVKVFDAFADCGDKAFSFNLFDCCNERSGIKNPQDIAQGNYSCSVSDLREVYEDNLHAERLLLSENRQITIANNFTDFAIIIGRKEVCTKILGELYPHPFKSLQRQISNNRINSSDLPWVERLMSHFSPIAV